ncbi:30S ribosomal protein S4, partial [Candidatus Curtissbacteria bacterium]|nr:30S ribosomal protein S4 [Candidatus Curtissbacteria bacterium]
GMLEKQFRKYYEIASRKKEATGEGLLSLLERRLDNVIYRIGLATNRRQARQLVSHGHVMVNDKKVTIPSFSVKINDVITLTPKAANLSFIKKLQEENKDASLVSWLEKKALVGKVKDLPKREDIEFDVNEQLIVEYYSR